MGIAGKCQPLDMLTQNSVEYFLYLFDVGLDQRLQKQFVYGH